MEERIPAPYIADVYPDKVQYLPGQEVRILVEMYNPCTAEMEVTAAMSVKLLDDELIKDEINVALPANSTGAASFTFTPPVTYWQGFGADISLIINNNVCHRLSTAFDVVSTWKKAPRYGFLSDFYKEDEDDNKDVEQMRKYHLNVVQFYDWMYRHDDLIPGEAYFIDPLNRRLSLNAVKNKIEICHKYGMKTIAYGAVYAASKEFYEKHREWALYDNSGNVQSLGNWLIIMNTSPESPWAGHIINEYRKAVEMLDFDGIQMDTYGFPKSSFSMLKGQKKLVKPGNHFPVLINNARKELENVKDDIGLIFNAVNNWPVETVAPSEQDAVYIEVWEPNERYINLNQLINRAREIGKKPVILAAYLKAFSKKSSKDPAYAENCFLLVSAVIFASGGYHILLGEDNGVLTEEYFANYAKMRDEFERTVRNYYDFAVRYANLLFDLQLADLSMIHANGRGGEFQFENGLFSSCGEPGRIWTIVKEKPGFKIINLINFSGLQSDIWNEGKESKPAAACNICVRALINEEVRGVFMASPDMDNGMPGEIEFVYEEQSGGRIIKFLVPRLEVWNLIYIKVI